MKALVVGLGQFGAAIAVALENAGVETIAIDSNMAMVNPVKDNVALAVCADATSYEALVSQGMEDADLLVAAIGSNFEAQILTVAHARRAGVDRVVARAGTETHRAVLEAVGADLVVNPERDAAHDTVLNLMIPSIGTQIKLAQGLCAIEVPAPEGLAGRTFHDQGQDLLTLHHVNLVALRRADKNGVRHTVLDPDERIQAGDTLFLAGDEADLAKYHAEP